MKIKVKYDGKVFAGTIPDRWQTMTVAQYIAIADCSTGVEMLSRLSGIDLHVFENTNINMDFSIEHIQKLIASIPDPSTVKDKKHSFEIMGKYVEPKYIHDLTWLQKDMIKQLLNDENDIIRCIPKCFAIWITPNVCGAFISNKVEVIEKEVLKLPVHEVYPWVLFFFKRLRTEKINLLASLKTYL